MVLSRVRQTIDQHNLIQYGDRIIVALSGGPDSMCLLHTLYSLREEYGIRLYAAHLNHRLRGLDAHRDALFVRDHCESLGIPCFIRAIDVEAYCKETSQSTENGARELRYRMFFELKEKLGADKIALGHNMNDQAETVLMRIMRGSGLNGLKGIDYKRRDGIIRPILDLKRDAIEGYCEQNGLNPRIDSTNLEPIYTRNRIRLELIPYIQREFNEGIVEGLSRMTDNIRSDSDFINQCAEEAFRQAMKYEDNKVMLSLLRLRRMHDAIRNRAVMMAIGYLLGDYKEIEQKHIHDVLGLLPDEKEEKLLNLPRGIFVYRFPTEFVFTTAPIVSEDVSYDYELKIPQTLNIVEINKVITTEIVTMEEFLKGKNNNKLKFLDYSKIKNPLRVRNRESKDKITLKVGNKKVKNLFIDLKIPKEKRPLIPIITDGNEIVLVGTYRMSENYKIDSGTKEILKIQIEEL